MPESGEQDRDAYETTVIQDVGHANRERQVNRRGEEGVDRVRGLSKGVREGIRLYLKAQKSQEIFRKLEELQRKNPVKTASEKEVELIRQDREDRTR